MTYSALNVANFFINKSVADGKPITPLKLQKLVYIAHGWWLAFKNDKLIEEPVFAWDYGPVIPQIYHEFKIFGSNPIGYLAPGYDCVKDDEEVAGFLDSIWRSYGRFKGSELSAMTHKKGTPWSNAFSPGEKGIIIPTESIREHYVSLKEQYGQQHSSA
jgi:uncharacterized phage-associated protein